ncbi:MAG: hypothetical protein GF383_11950 [Candidatus Lokiarchaeota archaeon]|nr:hypothetical protein [Candidatus Lokiarchaeota archaeon]MBD3341587.1 hypothetical protein [Candidatus Lokiarchaeota archaeon]
MTPPSLSSTDKRRITVNLDEIDYRIIEVLEGVIANSKSSVVYQMIKEWINQNSDRIMKTWDIDLAGIRRQVLAELKGIPAKKELEELELDIIEKLKEYFKTAEDMTPKELSELLQINEMTLKKIIFEHRDELLDEGLNLKYSQGRILRV